MIPMRWSFASGYPLLRLTQVSSLYRQATQAVAAISCEPKRRHATSLRC